MDPRRERLSCSRSQKNDRLATGEAQHQVNARKRCVAQVIHAVNLDHINVLRVEPVAGPRVNESERIATVLEAVIAVVAFADTKRVLLSKIGLETVGPNASTTVTSGSAVPPAARSFPPGLVFFSSCFAFFSSGLAFFSCCAAGFSSCFADFSGCAFFSPSRFSFLFFLLPVRLLRRTSERRL